MVGQWILITPASGVEGGGSIRECPAYGKCQVRNGRLRITRQTGSRIEGELRIQLPGDGTRELILPFTAPLLPFEEFCG